MKEHEVIYVAVYPYELDRHSQTWLTRVSMLEGAGSMVCFCGRFGIACILWLRPSRWYSRVTKDRTRGFKHWLVKQTQLCVTLITLWSHSRSFGTPQNSTSSFRSSLIFKKLRKWPTEWYFKYSTSGRDLIILQFAPVLQAVKPMDLDAYSHQIGVKNCSNDYDTSIFIEVTKGPCPPDF